MNLELKKGGNVSDSAGLLISILLRYPEVGMINYDPETKVLRFTFVLSKILSPAKLKNIRLKINSCLKTYYFLKHKNVNILRISGSQCESLTLIEIKRDVQTLNGDEIALIITIMRDCFKDSLVTENNDAIKEEDLLAQEELIGRMLESIRCTLQKKKLVAFREKGRVLVFNK